MKGKNQIRVGLGNGLCNSAVALTREYLATEPKGLI